MSNMFDQMEKVNERRSEVKNFSMPLKAFSLFRHAATFMACAWGLHASDSAFYAAIFGAGLVVSGILFCHYVYIFSFWKRG